MASFNCIPKISFSLIKAFTLVPYLTNFFFNCQNSKIFQPIWTITNSTINIMMLQKHRLMKVQREKWRFSFTLCVLQVFIMSSTLGPVSPPPIVKTPDFTAQSLADIFIDWRECTFTTLTRPTLKNKLWVGTNFIQSPSIMQPRGIVILIKPDTFKEVTSSPLQENLKISSSETANKKVFSSSWTDMSLWAIGLMAHFSFTVWASRRNKADRQDERVSNNHWVRPGQ